jgi:hypothetical protein
MFLNTISLMKIKKVHAVCVARVEEVVVVVSECIIET